MCKIILYIKKMQFLQSSDLPKKVVFFEWIFLFVTESNAYILRFSW